MEYLIQGRKSASLGSNIQVGIIFTRCKVDADLQKRGNIGWCCNDNVSEDAFTSSFLKEKSGLDLMASRGHRSMNNLL